MAARFSAALAEGRGATAEVFPACPNCGDVMRLADIRGLRDDPEGFGNSRDFAIVCCGAALIVESAADYHEAVDHARRAFPSD